MIRKETRKGTEKLPKGKGPKVPVRQESRISWFATFAKRSSAKKDPHVILGTHKYAPTTNPKVVANGWLNVYSCTQSKPVKKW